jgi:hypothetical protein
MKVINVYGLGWETSREDAFGRYSFRWQDNIKANHNEYRV